MILCVVAPVDHRYVVPVLEVSVTLPPSQNVVELPAVIAGCVGNAFTVTTVFADATLSHPEAFLTFTQ